MKPEHAREFVKLGNTFIPAENIRITPIPDEYNSLALVHRPVYFEIIFDTGTIWVVEELKKHTPIETRNQTIIISEFPRWGLTETKDGGITIRVSSWGEFLNLYNEKLKSIETDTNRY